MHAGDRVLAYDKEGIHRLDPETRSAEWLYALPGGFPGYGDVVALPDGSVLVTHRDAAGGTLIALAARLGQTRLIDNILINVPGGRMAEGVKAAGRIRGGRKA